MRKNAAFSFHHSIVIPNYSMSAALQSGKMMRENKSTTAATIESLSSSVAPQLDPAGKDGNNGRIAVAQGR